MRLFAHWCLVAVRYSVLTHAVHCWCWSHCGMMPLFLRCPIHGKGHISFLHQERFPFLHSVSFTVWHYSHFSQAISLTQIQLLTSWLIQCHYLPKAWGDEAVWGWGEVAWANMTLLSEAFHHSLALGRVPLKCSPFSRPAQPCHCTSFGSGLGSATSGFSTPCTLCTSFQYIWPQLGSPWTSAKTGLQPDCL